MSYILESLKKSDKERNIAETHTALAIGAPAFLENEVNNNFSWKFIIGLILFVFVLATLFVFVSNNQLKLQLLTDYQQSILFQQNASEPLSITAALDNSDAISEEALSQQQATLSKEEAVRLYQQALADKEVVSIDSLYQRVQQEALPNNERLEEPVNEAETIADQTQSLYSGFQSPQPEFISNQREALAQPTTNDEAVIPSIYDLDLVEKRNIPSIDYGAHVFATDLKSGFVILNGARRRIGDQLDNGIFIEKITEDSVILSYSGRVFSLPAMKNWSSD